MKQPPFPELFVGTPVWGQGNSLIFPNLLASIPTYTLHEKGSPTRKKLEKLYWEKRNSEYEALKSIYEKNVKVGTVWCGNTSASAKITKIFISEEKAYICYKASAQHLKDVEKENKNRSEKDKLKPIKSGKFDLSAFVSAIQNGTIRILS